MTAESLNQPRKKGWIGFSTQKHLDDSRQPIVDKLRDLLSRHQLEAFDDAVLLAQPSVMGIGFNPLSVYFVSRRGQPHALVLEVRNTPWRERETYVFAMNGRTSLVTRWAKTFHVSPFNPAGQHYRINARWPDAGHYALDLSLQDAQGTLFRAGFRLKPVAPSSFRDSAGRVVMPLITVGGIYWQALRLWFKGLPYQSYPQELKKG